MVKAVGVDPVIDEKLEKIFKKNDGVEFFVYCEKFTLNETGEAIRRRGTKILPTLIAPGVTFDEVFDEIIAINEFGKENKNKFKEVEIKVEKEKAPLISIIIPSRPFEKIISMSSLKAQTYKNIEIIKVIDKKKEGAPVCRNRGFLKAKGEFVLFSDNDLEWDKNAIAILYKTLKENPKASYSYGSYTLGEELIGDKEFSKQELLKSNYISTMSLIRREDFIPFDEKIKKFQDWDLWLTMLEKGKIGKFCGHCVFSTEKKDGISYGKNAMDSEEAKKIIMEKHSQRKELNN
ncbi:MAG: glycosyltransferase family 2 protein [Candidatus Heimdallarchaeota archaeon]